MPRHSTSRKQPPLGKKIRNTPLEDTNSPEDVSESSITRSLLRTPGLVTLDGCTLEGGGQLVRLALVFSALLHIPVYIHHIRGNRASRNVVGGLKSSHLAALEWLRDASRSGPLVEGATKGSSKVSFLPGLSTKAVKKFERSERHVIELRTPGSVWLIFQAIWPFVVWRGWEPADNGDGQSQERNNQPVRLKLIGGTNVSKSMSAEYVKQVLLPVAEKIGIPRCEVEVKKRGWTHGALQIGEADVDIMPLPRGASLPAFLVENRGGVTKIDISVLANPETVRNRLCSGLHALISKCFSEFAPEMEIVLSENSGDPRRLYVLAVAHTENGWRLGRDLLFEGRLKKKGNPGIDDKSLQEVVERVVGDLAMEVEKGGCVDEFLHDQLVAFQALAEGESAVDAGEDRRGSDVDGADGEGPSLHTRTVRWVVQEMLNGGKAMDWERVRGIGLKAGCVREGAGNRGMRADRMAENSVIAGRGDNGVDDGDEDSLTKGVASVSLN